MAAMVDANVTDASGKTALDVAMDRSQALAARAQADESVLHQANLKVSRPDLSSPTTHCTALRGMAPFLILYPLNHSHWNVRIQLQTHLHL